MPSRPQSPPRNLQDETALEESNQARIFFFWIAIKIKTFSYPEGRGMYFLYGRPLDLGQGKCNWSNDVARGNYRAPLKKS